VIRQFDIIQNPSPRSRDRIPYLAVLQSHYLRALDTLIVAPLIPAELVQADNGTSIPVVFDGRSFTLDLGLLSNLEASSVGRALGSVAENDYEIRRALDRLFTGF
jgi:toxin CcdB